MRGRGGGGVTGRAIKEKILITALIGPFSFVFAENVNER